MERRPPSDGTTARVIRAAPSIFAVLCTLVIGGTASAGTVQGDRHHLETVIAAFKANLAKIHTWSATAHVDDDEKTFDAREVVAKADAGFVYEAGAPASRTRWWFTYVRGVQKDFSGLPSPYGAVGDRWDVMRLPAGYYTLERGHKDVGATTWERDLVIRPLEKAPRPRAPTSVEFDPMTFLYVRDTPVSDYLASKLAMWDKFPASRCNVSVKREGDVVEFYVELDGSVNSDRFDLARGGNVVAIDDHDTAGHSWEQQVTYIKSAGAWVPSTFTLALNGKTDRFSKRSVEFANIQVNQPLAADEFTLKKLGVVHGTRVVDSRSVHPLIYNFNPSATTRPTRD